jgi:peptidoglycan/xylan/chitin deacetylase (PgdA/CDA1 family)
MSRRQFLANSAKRALPLVFITGCGAEAVRVVSVAPRGSSPAPSGATIARLPASVPPIDRKKELKRLDPPLPGFIRSGPTDKPIVAITVDDLFGVAGAQSLTRALDTARDRSVTFTFFPTGGALEVHLQNGLQDVWRRAAREGHEIGNHTYTHRALTRLSDQEIRDELGHTQQLLTQVLGPEYDSRMRLMRPPGGAGGFEPEGNPRIVNVVGALGYSMVMWTIDSQFTGGGLPYLDKIVRLARNGSIILLHFTTFSADNLPLLVDRLRAEKHLEPSTVSAMFS